MEDFAKKIESFFDNEENFIFKIRELKGLDNENIEAFETILKELKSHLKDKKSVDKKIAFLLIGLPPILIYNISSYPITQQQEISEVVARLNDEIVSVFE